MGLRAGAEPAWAAVLVRIVAGGALFGVAGTLLAVPVVAVAVNVTREFLSDGTGSPTEPDPASPST